MVEFVKIVCVICKFDLDVLYDVILVFDVIVGQNVLSQVEVFCYIVDVIGIVMIKLDGMVKGGVLVVIVEVYVLLIYFVGVGEKVEDL